MYLGICKECMILSKFKSIQKGERLNDDRIKDEPNVGNI